MSLPVDVRKRMKAAAIAEIELRRDALAVGKPIYCVYRCPVCLLQHRAPGSHKMAGDDICQGIGPDGTFHTARLERIGVLPFPVPLSQPKEPT